MDELNKNQFILLVLLISFVTSIATGIITTTLLEQAPVEVTRTINQIVEKTIQTVTPGTVVTSPGQKEVTTIVVKEEDSIISAIDKNIKSIVRINEKDGSGDVNFYGIGIVISKDGTIMTDRKTIVSADVYVATMSDGTQLVINPSGVDKNTDIILFKATQPAAKPYVFVPATLSDAEPKLGQTLIAIAGDTQNSSSVGRAALLSVKNTTVGTTTTQYLSGITLDATIKDLVDGTPLFNLSGDIVGINLSPATTKSFTPIAILKKEIADLTAVPTKTP